ncbi:MAG: hypothetical protein Altm2KO_38950 [Alteromonas macleodii]|uniref:Uncharacterized protein n=1 Tax=marine sediment metagenome TaxID=412755 RepID=A0A1B6NVT9_9ZZZZ|nr:hypothetical protein ACZ81_05360 [Alteromonas macleodii]AMN11724.1 hypothetical protein ACZ81_09125 [Alteromonas macleodii]AMN11787.1 hypothetical protein ACZ81_09480 [Alteromonas macleodii]AMN11846.1 hypothetical protein ACZ81_09805 [Alteromonas macleodii]AMN13518.1 hypothetical protein ACZ81_19130 [Alteromonas macleodii]
MVNVQGGTQDVNRCEVADEAVVVSKVRPVKASNGVEGKTELTISIVFDGVTISQKLIGMAKGGST